MKKRITSVKRLRRIKPARTKRAITTAKTTKATQRKGRYAVRYAQRFSIGYNDGYGRGRDAGVAAYGVAFPGTSIIIPTYNKLPYLQECIESIAQYTPEAYELIIIDNASTDGTAGYLKKLAGKLRYRINDSNLGFAGSVNQGLMMARGSTILILNNDSVVTARWLSNLLTCLHAHREFGIVGPVTNYISGEQLIETRYTDIVDMQQFAASFNQSDARSWSVTERLTGFCMLMRREDFERLGYFDEGFEIGNCEDDDYGLRARLLGMKLVIAKDTFIHHYGSVSMRALNSHFDEVYERNLAFYSRKWADPQGMLSLDWQHSQDCSALQTIDSYPTGIIVRGADEATYWIEHGMRYLLVGAGSSDLPAVRVSQVDLRRWALGGTLPPEEALMKMEALHRGINGTETAAMEGKLVQLEGDAVGQIKGGRLHRFIGRQALADWQLDRFGLPGITIRNVQVSGEGPPIISPPVLKAGHL